MARRSPRGLGLRLMVAAGFACLVATAIATAAVGNVAGTTLACTVLLLAPLLLSLREQRRALDLLRTGQRSGHLMYGRLKQIADAQAVDQGSACKCGDFTTPSLITDVQAAIASVETPDEALVITDNPTIDLLATGATVTRWSELAQLPHLVHRVVVLDLGLEALEPSAITWLQRALRWPHGVTVCHRADDGFRSKLLSRQLGAPLSRTPLGRLEAVMAAEQPSPTWGKST